MEFRVSLLFLIVLHALLVSIAARRLLVLLRVTVMLDSFASQVVHSKIQFQPIVISVDELQVITVQLEHQFLHHVL